MSVVRFDTQGEVATLTLNRPDQRNAMTPEMIDGVLAGIGALPATSRSLILAGAGKVFCAGFDLALCQASPDGSVMRLLLTGLSRCIVALRALPIPVVAAAHGAAIAGGCALLGGCDFVVADRGAKFGYPVTRLGVSPAVSAPFFAGAVGHGRARERLLGPSLIDGVEAHRIGVVHELLEAPEQVMPRARSIAASLAAKPRGGLSATRALLFELEALGAQPAKALEASMSLTGSDEERSRLAAALRRP